MKRYKKTKDSKNLNTVLQVKSPVTSGAFTYTCCKTRVLFFRAAIFKNEMQMIQMHSNSGDAGCREEILGIPNRKRREGCTLFK
jgi:hypothetical protein